jgi:hypothetical protein
MQVTPDGALLTMDKNRDACEQPYRDLKQSWAHRALEECQVWSRHHAMAHAPSAARHPRISADNHLPPAGQVLPEAALAAHRQPSSHRRSNDPDHHHKSTEKRDRTLIRDCSKDTCVVKGTEYPDSKVIPGNKPVPLRWPDGTAVKDPYGNEVSGPQWGDFRKLAEQAGKDALRALAPEPLSLEPDSAGAALGKYIDTVISYMSKFRHNGPQDYQRLQSDDGKTIFTKDYRHFTNIAIGYVGAAMGLSASEVARISHSYCVAKGCSFSPEEPKSARYYTLPIVNVADYRIGAQLYRAEHPK